MSGPDWRDARQMFGADARRVIWTPADAARAESLVAEFGGILSKYAGDASGVCVEWMDPSGYRVALEGVDASSVLGSLSAMLRTRRGTRTEGEGSSSFFA